MSTAGRHAVIGLFYAGVLTNKGYLQQVLNVAKEKGGGFGKYSFLSADEFSGHADPKLDGVLLEGTIAGAVADRIEAAFKALGKEVRRVKGSFEDEFKKYEEEAGAGAGVTSDPPMSATDNVTADRTSPMAHVETDGRNEPRLWQGATGTSLDHFGLPLTTTDRKDASAAERVSGLEAQSQAVTARTAESAAAVSDDAAEKAKAATADQDKAQKARQAAADEEAKANEKAAAETTKAAKADAAADKKDA